MVRPLARAALSLGLVGTSWLALHDAGAQDAERAMADGIRGLRRPQLDPVVAVATDLGSVYGLTGTALALAATGRRRTAVELFCAGVVAWGVAQAAKPLANRPRPYDAGEAERLVSIPAGTSWPSGHSAVATAMGLAIASNGGVAAGALGASLAGFVGGSRVYVGVHHPTDVSAGMGVGVLSHLLAGVAVRRLSRRRGASGRRGSSSSLPVRSRSR